MYKEKFDLHITVSENFKVSDTVFVTLGHGLSDIKLFYWEQGITQQSTEVKHYYVNFFETNESCSTKIDFILFLARLEHPTLCQPKAGTVT